MLSGVSAIGRGSFFLSASGRFAIPGGYLFYLLKVFPEKKM
jgi:hypothetical protein